METEIYVTRREQLTAALLGVAGGDYIPGLPFVIYLEGTHFRVRAPKGITGKRARTMIRNIRRTPAAAFKSPKESEHANQQETP